MLDSLDTLIAFVLIFAIVSLLITIVVQMVTSLFNLRGRNLAWGIAEAFEAIAPELKSGVGEKGKQLANHLLKDPLISDSQVKQYVGMAKAVRPDELFDLLHRIAVSRKPGTPHEIQRDVIHLFKSLGVPESVFELVESERRKLEALREDIDAQLARLPDGPAKEQLQKLKTETEAKLGNAEAYAGDAATRWLALGESETHKIYQKFKHWFETGDERSKEWFTTEARIITGILGLVAAIALQLDTIEIYKFVSSNREVRANLVARVGPVIEHGEKILKASPTVMEQSLRNLAGTTNESDPSIAKSGQLKGIQITASDTTATVKAKIRTALADAKASQAEVDKTLEDFDKATVSEVKAQLASYSVDWNGLAKSLDETGFELFPKDGWRWKNEKCTWQQIFGHTMGVLFTTLLLSLGAPFWFNTLKSLASLRSSVVNNISEESKAELRSNKAQQPSKPPPTVL